MQVFALKSMNGRKKIHHNRWLLHPRHHSTSPANTHTPPRHTNNTCIQSSEGVRPRAATREHPDTHINTHTWENTAFTLYNISHCPLFGEYKGAKCKHRGQGGVSVWQEKCLRITVRKKRRVFFILLFLFVHLYSSGLSLITLVQQCHLFPFKIEL